MLRKAIVILGVVLFTLPVRLDSQNPVTRRSWELTDQFRIKYTSNLALSPDCKNLFFTCRSRLWLLPVEGGEPEAITGGNINISSPRWSPDGKRIAFISHEGDLYSLWIMNRNGQNLRKLVQFERSNAYLGMTGNDLCWSPDGKHLAYTAAGPRYYTNIPKPTDPPNYPEVMVIDRLLYKDFYYYSDMRRTYVYVISVDGGEPGQIASGEYDYHSISWSPEGTWIACVSNRTGKDDYNANNDICLLAPDGSEMVQLTRTLGPEYTPVFSPDGSKIAYLNRLRDHRSKESDAELYKVYVIPVSGGTPVNLTEPLDRWSSSPQWSADGSTVFFTAQNAGKVGLYSAPVTGGKVNTLIDLPGQVRSYAIGEKGEIFYVFLDYNSLMEIYKRTSGNRPPEKLTAFNREFVSEVEIIKPESFTCSSFDGLQIQGWIMKPYGYAEGKKYPLILSVHGGPHGQYGYRFSSLFQYLTANGFAVMFTNPRGSTGYGQAFSDACVGDLGGGDYKDIMACVDYVVENYEFVDPERMGVTGGSYGGYMTNWIITQDNRFKAAVPVAGISNLISQWGTDGNTLWFESDGGFMPFEDYEKAWAMSPLKYVANCKTPTLFIHGAWDFCVNLGQAEEMYTALKKLGVDAVLAIYPDEGHGVRQPDHVVDYHRRTLEWFTKYLK